VRTSRDPYCPSEAVHSDVRLVEAVIAQRHALQGWPQTVLICLKRLFRLHPPHFANNAAEAEMLVVLDRCYGTALFDVPTLRCVVDLIVLQGGVRVVQRTLWGVAFADDSLQKVLVDVIPDFTALVKRYPTVFLCTRER
jgi:hypothetical protein